MSRKRNVNVIAMSGVLDLSKETSCEYIQERCLSCKWWTWGIKGVSSQLTTCAVATNHNLAYLNTMLEEEWVTHTLRCIWNVPLIWSTAHMECSATYWLASPKGSSSTRGTAKWHSYYVKDSLNVSGESSWLLLLDKATQTGEVHKKSCHVTINGSITSSIRIAA